MQRPTDNVRHTGRLQVGRGEQAKRYTGRATPAEASKLRGVMGFTFTAYYGQVGRGGLTALLQRQYSDKEPWYSSDTLTRSYRYYLICWDVT
jgi:hypothetical protein